jgi:hypothetical protein
MSPADHLVSCPDCGYQLHRPAQDRCTECGLRWADWMDSHEKRVRMRVYDWLLLLLVFPIMASIPPLLTARGAITGARTFESSYLLTLPGFAGIVFLSWWYSAPVFWRMTRARRSAAETVPLPPSRIGGLIVLLLLMLLQAFLFLAVIRLGFIVLVQPLRPPSPTSLQSCPMDVGDQDFEWVVSRSS